MNSPKHKTKKGGRPAARFKKNYSKIKIGKQIKKEKRSSIITYNKVSSDGIVYITRGVFYLAARKTRSCALMRMYDGFFD